MKNIIEKNRSKISGVLNCYDRLIFTGTLKSISYAEGMTFYLNSEHIKIFDYPRFAEPYRDKIRKNIEAIAKENEIEIEFIRKKNIRKEDIIKDVIKRRGEAPGIVHILSAMESCASYRPWHNKKTGKTYLKGSQSKCLHYYVYFIDEYLGLCYFRIPTWAPFRLQVYINGHNILKNELDNNNIGYTMLDNTFDSIEDWSKAQELADGISIKKIHKKLDEYADKFCPVSEDFNQRYHWSIMQAEYATDIVFKKQKDLEAIYEDLTVTAVHIVKPENIATFLGKKLESNYKGEIGNNYNIRIQGTRIKHTMGKNSIKMYDKFSKILRIETTTNNISFFKHYREVVHRDGSRSYKLAGLKKNIYSLPLLKEKLQASNKRYLEFISTIEDKSNGRKRLEKISQPKTVGKRKYKGFNLFDEDDLKLLKTITRGEFNISGFRNKNIRQLLPYYSSNKISRLLKRLRTHGIIKRIANTYKYYMTKLGRRIIMLCAKLKEIMIIPAFNY